MNTHKLRKQRTPFKNERFLNSAANISGKKFFVILNTNKYSLEK